MTNAIKVLSILTTMALFLPVFSGYLLTFVMFLIWLYLRLTLKSASVEAGYNRSSSVVLWTKPILIWLSVISLSALFSSLDGNPMEKKEALHYWGNSLVKYGLLWFFMRGFIGLAMKRYNYLDYLTLALFPVAGLHFFYCLAQRYWGIDWVHGFDAMLPENRFAYGVYRVSGFSSHPLTIGYQLCFFVILGLGLSFLEKLSKFQRYLAAGSAIFAVLTVAISGSRGPQVVVLAILIAMFSRRLSRRSWAVFIPTGLLFSAVAARFGAFRRFTEMSSLSASGDTRFMDWRVHAQAFLDHPWIGIGPAGFRSAISTYYMQFGGSANIGLAHNFYLQVAAELGIVGLTAFGAWFLTWPRYAWSLKNVSGKSCFYALFTGMFLSAITQNSLRDSGVLFTLTFVTMVLASAYSEDKELQKQHERESR